MPADDLAAELDAASLALVGQRADIREFNLPSRVMTLMAHGVPVVAACDPRSELAQVIEASGGGWVADRRRRGATAEVVHGALSSPDECAARGAAARVYAAENFNPELFVERFESSIRAAIEGPTAHTAGRRR